MRVVSVVSAVIAGVRRNGEPITTASTFHLAREPEHWANNRTRLFYVEPLQGDVVPVVVRTDSITAL